MTVWIEYAFAQNFIIDFSLLYLTNKTVRLPVHRLRLFGATVLGTAFALLFPLLALPKAISYIVRLSFGAVLCLVGLPAKGKGNLSALFFFYLYTFLYGGFLMGVYSVFSLEYDPGGSLVGGNFAVAALAFLPFFCLFSLRGAQKLWKRLKKKTVDYVCDVFFGTERVRLNGLMDTGNSLQFNGNPVCLLAGEVKERVKNPLPTEDYIFVRTATGEGVFPVFQAKIEIYSEGKENIIDKVYFAVSAQPLGGGYEVILHPQLLKES